MRPNTPPINTARSALAAAKCTPINYYWFRAIHIRCPMRSGLKPLRLNVRRLRMGRRERERRLRRKRI